MDASGNFVWADRLGGGGGEGGYGIAADAAGNVYVAGDFTSSPADFNPGPGTFNMFTFGIRDAWVGKFNPAGGFLWARQMGSPGNDGGYAISVDFAGNIVTSGYFSGTAAFGPFNLTSAGSDDVFVARLDTAGNFLWAAALGGTANDSGRGILLEPGGNVVTTGNFAQTADFDPGPGNVTLTSAGGNDGFVWQLDASGNFIWAGQLGGSAGDRGNAIAADGSGRIYLTGSFASTAADFIPGPGTVNLTSAGAADMFIARIPSVVITESAGSTTVAEGGATDTYTVVLSWPPTANVLVTLTPDTQSTVSSPVLTFTPANWNVFQTITVTAVNDTLVEGIHNGVITHTATSTDSHYNGISIDPVTAQINDNDIPGATISPTGGSTSVVEGGGTDTYLLVLTAQPTANVILTLSPNAQITFAPVTLTFTPANWSTAQTATVTAVDDFVVEGNHTGVINHTSSSADSNFNGLVIASLTANVADNDMAGVNVLESGGFTAVAEGGAGDTYTVVLNSQPTANVVVTVASGSQVAVSAGLVTFTPANWNVSQTVTVTAIDDLVSELSPHFGTILQSASSADPNYQGIAIASVTAAITDNDPPGVIVNQTGGSTDVAEGGATDVYTLSLVSLPTANVVITFNTGTQLAPLVPLTFTPANWNVPQNVTVTAVDDLLVEGTPHPGTITHTAASADAFYNSLAIYVLTASITDNDVAGVVSVPSGGANSVIEGGASDTYTITLATPPTANVVLTLNPGTQLAVSAATLTFTPANWNTAQTVTVTAVDDLVAEGTPHTGVITTTASSGDVFYNNLGIAPTTVNITDNDLAGVTLVQSGSSTDVAEGGASDAYTVVLASQPTATVVVTISPSSQVSASLGQLTFTPATWSTPQTVTVAALDDLIAEGPHTGNITHAASSADPFYTGLAIPVVTANIADNDVAGIVVTPSGGSTNVTEGGPADTYTIALTSQPTANVTITLNAGTQLAVTPTVVTFTPASWNTVRTVAVTAVDDQVYQGTRNVPISHSAASTDVFYGGLSAVLTVEITDNEQGPGVRITEPNGATTLLEGTAQAYTAVLTTQPTATVVVSVSVPTSLSATVGSLTFTPASWNVPQPVLLTALTDGIYQGEHVGVVTHSAASADPLYNAIPVASVTAHILDSGGLSISGTERADRIVVTFTPTNVQVAINGKTTFFAPGFDQLVILAAGGADHVEVYSPTVPVLVQGGLGVDRLHVNGAPAGGGAFTLGYGSVAVNGVGVAQWEIESLIVGGGSGTDTFTVQGVPAYAVEFKGNRGNDTVVGPDRNNAWRVTTASGGTLNQSIKINGVGNWTGGSLADSFAFAAGKSIAGQLDGGAGQNTLDLSAYTAPVLIDLRAASATGMQSFRNIDAVVGGKNGADRLIGANQANTWNITAGNSGNVNGLSFRNIENLTGGAFDDSFALADSQRVRGKIDGGGGQNTLDLSAWNVQPLSINLQTRTATGTGGILNLTRFLGGAGSADTFLAGNQPNAWNLTGLGAGDVGGVLFDGFENLVGGSLSDAFTLAAAGDWFGTLDGRGSSDTLTAFPRANVWTTTGPGAGTLNGRRFQGIENRR